jgi:Protein of unknown function (DUF4239)
MAGRPPACGGADGLFYWIYDYPTWQMGVLFAVVFLSVSLIGLFVVRARFTKWIHTEHRANDMVGVILASFSVLYGILLGLVAVGAYQNFSSVSDIVDRESGSLAGLYRDVSALPQPYRARLQADLRSYTRYTIDYGWPAQRRGHITTGSTQRMTIFFNDLTSFSPTDQRTEVIFSEAFRQFNNLTELRRARLNSVTTGIPAVLWFVVGIGAFLNIVLIWMLDMEIHVHVILAAVLSLFLGSVIFLVVAMDNPYRGEVSVGPDALELVYRTYMLPVSP